MRKLDELPFHLAMSGRYEDLISICLGSFAWLYAKLAACGVAAVHVDYDRAQAMPAFVCNTKLSSACRLISGALRLATSVLQLHPGQLAQQLRGRLVHCVAEHAPIAALIAEISEHHRSIAGSRCDEARPAVVVNPGGQTLLPSGGPLQMLLHGHTMEVTSLAVSRDGLRLLTGSGDARGA